MERNDPCLWQRQKNIKMPYAGSKKNKTAQRQREIVPSRKLLKTWRRRKRIGARSTCCSDTSAHTFAQA